MSVPGLSVLVIVGSILLAGGNLAQGRPPTIASASKPKQTSPLPDDSTLAEAVRRAIGRSKIRIDGLRVRAERGVVILEGRADVVQHKAVATRLAKRAGARWVDNRIQLTEAARQRLARRQPRTQPRKVGVEFRPPGVALQPSKRSAGAAKRVTGGQP